MTGAERRCPHCGGRLEYDAATGMFWCPRLECGFAMRADARRTDEGRVGARRFADAGYTTPDDTGAEWSPEPRSRRRTALVVLVTVAAVLAMALSPLLFPRRPFLSVSPGGLVFEDQTGTGVMPQALAVQNQGKGRMEWRVTSDVSWLTIEPMSGSIESELQILTVRADTAALPEGSHAATFSVSADGAQNSPQTVSVLVELLSPPEARAIRGLLGEDVEVYYGVQPPYVTGPIGVPIRLASAEGARDVSWQELLQFLEEDATDADAYIQDLYMCGTFAETLYNNAVGAGIRAAWVSLDIRGREVGHALNAFLTTDRGLVFVDCTGGDVAVLTAPSNMREPCDRDRVAYVKPGMEYGLISLDRAESPSYEYYSEYSAAWDNYLADLAEYNRLAADYNAFVSGRTFVAGSAEAREAQRLHRELQSLGLNLEMQKEVLGECNWVSLGIVERVYIYW